MSDAIPEASFRPNNMTRSLSSKKESWKTWRDGVEVTMAKKRARIIAIATGLYADSYFTTSQLRLPEKQISCGELWCVSRRPHHCIPLPWSQPHLSASRILFLHELGGGGKHGSRRGSGPNHYTPHTLQGLWRQNKDGSYSEWGHLSFLWTVWIHRVYLSSLLEFTRADHYEQAWNPARRCPSR